MAIISEVKCKRMKVKIEYEDPDINVTDIQGDKIKIVGTAAHYI